MAGMSEALQQDVINVTLTNADTEYSFVLPPGTKYYSMQCRTAFAVRHAVVSGLVAGPTAPYVTLKSGDWYNSPEKFRNYATALDAHQIEPVIMVAKKR